MPYNGVYGPMLDQTVGAPPQGQRGQLGLQQGFVGGENFATTGVEGFFAPDGVMVGNIFLLTAESPADVVDGLRHLRVRRSCMSSFRCSVCIHSADVYLTVSSSSPAHSNACSSR